MVVGIGGGNAGGSRYANAVDSVGPVGGRGGGRGGGCGMVCIIRMENSCSVIKTESQIRHRRLIHGH